MLAEVRQFKEEIAKLRSNLTNFISGQVKGGSSLRNTDGMDSKAISLIVYFLTIHNEYFSNHSYNSASYQIDNTNHISMTGPQNFYFTLKQGNAIQLICQNINNRKDCPPTCRYRHLYGHCVGSHLTKNYPSSAMALGSNSVFLWYQWLISGIFQSSQPYLFFYSFSIPQSFLSISEPFSYLLIQSNAILLNNPSLLKIKEWMELLSRYLDKAYMRTLLQIICSRVKVRYMEPLQIIIGPNLLTANNAPNILNQELDKQIAHNRVTKLNTIPDTYISSPS